MLAHVLLPLMTLVVASDEWRSSDFQKAKVQLDAVLEKRGGQGVILELKRTSTSKVTGYAEARGQGAWILKAMPKSNSAKVAKPIEVIRWDVDAFFIQAKPLTVEFSVLETEAEMTFILTTKHFGELMWNKLLPNTPNESKVFVFYIPEKKTN